MKRLFLIVVLATVVVVVPTTYAEHNADRHNHNAFYDEARVMNVEPIKRIVHVSVPDRECWDEEVHYPGAHVDAADAARNVFVGGIIGGIVGHQFGSGRGKDAATLAGTLIGASIAHDRAKKMRTAQDEYVAYEQRCRIVYQQRTEERVDGYWVTYRYQAETFRTRLPYDPGAYIRVRVRITPVHN